MVTTRSPRYIKDQIEKVNPAGVMRVVNVSESSLVVTPLSGRTIAMVFMTIIKMVERNWRTIMRKGKKTKTSAIHKNLSPQR